MIRIGIGYDIHRLEIGRPLILGGIEISFEKGLIAHSDGDALAHAITDALLGAAALGNIGQHFPDTDPAYKDADSMTLLSKTIELLHNAGYRIVNIDSNIIAEAPKLTPHIPAMIKRLSQIMELEENCISVKARTNEQVGPEGRGEAIRTQAVVLIESI